MKYYDDIPVCGEPIEENALQQIKRTRSVCDFAAMMADNHMGYSVPIGGIMASTDLISPQAVGFDIACGNKAARLAIDAGKVIPNIGKIMDKITDQISFGIGRSAGWNLDDPLFESSLWHELECLQKRSHRGGILKDKAYKQLGTVGSGNHYVDIFVDENDQVWVGVHFGSRGFGHSIATWFLEKMGAEDGMETIPCTLDVHSDLGTQYLMAMKLGGEYAYAGRNAVVAKVAEILETEILEEVHNHHNFAWLETHNGTEYWVCRKGATPAFPGQKGFVGGSMGDNSVILQGKDSEDSKALFYSTVHGAGRVMSRRAATGKSKFGKQKGEGAISKEMMLDWIKSKGVTLRGADTDEAPQAYKRLDEVLPQQGDTIEILHTLRPIGVAMAGPDEFDPYKD